MTLKEYIKWANSSIKELSKSLGIPKTFIKEKEEEQQ